MKIVLLKNIQKLGNKGDVIEIKDGYALNFLIPKGDAAIATKNNTEKATRKKKK